MQAQASFARGQIGIAIPLESKNVIQNLMRMFGWFNRRNRFLEGPGPSSPPSMPFSALSDFKGRISNQERFVSTSPGDYYMTRIAALNPPASNTPFT
jgi:hypothetical protein